MNTFSIDNYILGIYILILGSTLTYIIEKLQIYNLNVSYKYLKHQLQTYDRNNIQFICITLI